MQVACQSEGRMSDDDDLARYQQALLEVLARGGDPSSARDELCARAPEQSEYVQGFEPRMVELGMLLTAKWARRC